MDRYYYVYILTNKSNKVLYTGVTNNLLRRVYEHKNKHVKGFSSKYNLSKLVYYEEAEDIYGAITREKQIKGYVRAKKIKLIESMNSEWKDLYKELMKEEPCKNEILPENKVQDTSSLRKASVWQAGRQKNKKEIICLKPINY